MMVIKTYLFDFDDTIISTKIYAEIYQPILEMIKVNLDINDEQLKMKAKELDLKMNKFGRWDTGDLCRELNLLEEYYEILESNIKVMPVLHDLVIEIFQKIKEQNLKIGIVSNSMIRTIRAYLNKYKLNQYVDFVFSYDDAKCKKSKETYWNILINKEDLNPYECLVIGDDEIDDQQIPKKLGFQTFIIHSAGDLNKITLQNA